MCPYIVPMEKYMYMFLERRDFLLSKYIFAAHPATQCYSHEPVLKRCGIINTLTIGSRERGGVILHTFTGAWQWWIVNKDYLQSIKIQVFYYQVHASFILDIRSATSYLWHDFIRTNVLTHSQLSFATQQFQIWLQLATIKDISAATHNNYEQSNCNSQQLASAQNCNSQQLDPGCRSWLFPWCTYYTQKISLIKCHENALFRVQATNTLMTAY